MPAFTLNASTVTVGELLDRWLDEAVPLTVRPRTLASYTYIVRVHLRPALGDVPLASLTAQHVQGLLNAKAASGLAPRTVGYLRGVPPRPARRPPSVTITHRRPGPDVGEVARRLAPRAAVTETGNS